MSQFTDLDRKPYSQWTADDKIAVAYSILAKTGSKSTAAQRASVDESTFTLAEMRFYARAMRVAVESDCVFGYE